MSKTKFQVLYRLEVDLEVIWQRAGELNLFIRSDGGRSSKGEEPTNAQLVIKLKQPEATLLVSRKCVQVYWSGEWRLLDDIEHVLEKILQPNVTLKSLRESVPTIDEAEAIAHKLREQCELLKEIGEKKAKLKEVETALDFQVLATEWTPKNRKKLPHLYARFQQLQASLTNGDSEVKRAKKLALRS